MVYIDIGNTFVKIASHTGDMTGNVLDSGQSADMDEWYVHLRARHGKLDDIITILNSEVLAAMPVLACSVVPFGSNPTGTGPSGQNLFYRPQYDSGRIARL